MAQKVDVVVIIPTYNRASMLASAIESILRQVSTGIDYELVVVDNNSDDDTRRVVESFMQRGENVRYLFEKEQGVSNARNTGILNTNAEILAFMDDDVIAQEDWISTIKRCFDQYPDILFLGGKVLPNWKTPPPAWLTTEHWSPLAIVDYGNEPFFVDWNLQLCLVTANLAVRRSAFDRFGLFSPKLDRCEDHEFEFRILRSAGKGLYTPELIVAASVQNERLAKSYHRAWWSGRGRTLARIRAYEISEIGGSLDNAEAHTVRLFGTPSHVYKELLTNAFGWLIASIRRKESQAFYFESHGRDVFNYIRETFTLWKSIGNYSKLTEIASFVPRLALKKIKNYMN